MSILNTPLTLRGKRAIPVTDAEERLLAAVKSGTTAMIPGSPKPDSTTGWTDDQTIRAAFLRHVCLHPDRYDIDPLGIQIAGARIWGELDLCGATFDHPLRILKTRFEHRPDFMDARIKTFGFKDGFSPGILADRLRVDGALQLMGSTFNGEVRLLGAAIQGNLDCVGTTFNNADDNALNASGMSVGGAMFLNSVTADGETNLVGAAITGPLECTGATFTNAGGYALSADSLSVGGAMFLNSVTTRGETNLVGATVANNLECPGSTFTNPEGHALNVNRLTVGGSMFMSPITADGHTNLAGAAINGNLFCNGATFANKKGMALNANRLNVGGSMFLKTVTARGEINMVGATITGNLTCHGARFTNPKKTAFEAQRMTVVGRMFWDEFTAPPRGDVDFRDARVGDYLDDATGWPEAGTGHLHLDGFRYESWGHETTAKELRDWLGRMPERENSVSPSFFPQPYEQLIKVLRDSGHERDARKIAIAKQDRYRAFLKAQDGFQSKVQKLYDTNPEQYRAFNRVKRFNKIQRAYLSRPINFFRRALFGFIKAVANYGYEPWRAFYWLGGLWLAGTLVFGIGEATTYMRPAKERITASPHYVLNQDACKKKAWRFVPAPAGRAVPPSMCIPQDYPAFHAVTYALDTLVPIVDLHQESYWEPSSVGWTGGALRFYLWFHIMAGWVLTTIAVLGFTGLIKQD